jgi:DNA-binding response OmpR family regulator
MLLGGMTALVIEDERMITDILEEMLIDLGCAAVLRAETLDSALAAIEDRKIDVALVDINLDGVVSYPAVAKLMTRNIPFIFESAVDPSLLMPPWNSRPAVQKPFNFELVEAALRQALG